MPVNLLTNETNLEKIQSEFLKARSEILICSAWIASGILEKVLTKTIRDKVKSGQLKLRILIRLGEIKDMKFTDQGVFQIIEKIGRNALLKYHKSLHAKMFVVDRRWAMIGSFNLTGGGFGTEDSPGSNPEAGFEFTDPSGVQQVIDRFNELWDHPDVHEINERLLGFVLSPSSSEEFSLLGVKELKQNMFVQVNAGDDKVIIGNIYETEKNDFSFYNEDLETFDFLRRMELTKSFGNDSLGNKAKAIATVPKVSTQIKVGRVKITNMVLLKEGKVVSGGLVFNTIPPDVASEVQEAEKGILEQIYNAGNFAPATLFSNPEVEAGFDPVELTTKHFSVFGSTGSGKSYFVKYLLSNDLYDWYCKKQKGRIIIFDPHNEYTAQKDMPADFVNDKNKFETIEGSQYNARLIRDIDDLEEAVNIKFASRDEKTRVDKILLASVKKGHKNKEFIDALKKEALQRSGTGKIDLDREVKKLSRDIDSSFYQYLSELQDLAPRIVDQELESGETSMEDIRNEYGGDKADAKKMYVHAKLIELYGKLSPEMQKALKEQVINKNIYRKLETYFRSDIRVISEETIEAIEDAFRSQEITIEELQIVKGMNKPKEYRVNLAGIHEEDIRHKITASILTQIFEEKKEKHDKVMNTLFVIEEAHNFAPEGGGKNNPAARILKKIASEGRKFSLGLIVITQRPAYVSKDILSQCCTQAIFRLINVNDLQQIEEVVEGVGEGMVEQLPRFETGQAIFSGVAIGKPVIVKAKKI